LIITLLILFPILVNLTNKKVLKSRLGKVAEASISAILLYGVIVLSSFVVDWQIQKELSAFDLNNDGVFSGAEITPRQEEAFNRVMRDTGRTFAPITGAVFSIVYFFVVWIIISKVSWFGKKNESNNT